MSIDAQSAARIPDGPLGTSGDLSRRLLLHHVPLALASAAVLVLFMNVPLFDADAYPHADIFSGTLPQPRDGDHAGPMGHVPGPTEPMDLGAGHAGVLRHGGAHSGPIRHGEEHAAPVGQRFFVRQLTFGTGYVAIGLLGLTLLIGPANLMLHRRLPVSNYLSRDVGTWAVVFSVVHTIFALQVHGSGRIRDFLNFFVAPNGNPWLNSFGLANWTGLAALVIAVGLLAISSDFALRKLKARLWKWLQRFNYALFALVILHAFFYGALLRVTSPFTLLLGLSLIAVLTGQGVGIWLWRRR